MTTTQSNPGAQSRLPVTVLSGFLGAGKTTLLNDDLNNHDVIVLNKLDLVTPEQECMLVTHSAEIAEKWADKIIDLNQFRPTSDRAVQQSM